MKKKVFYEESWYYKKTQELKLKITTIFGAKCELCKSNKNLQLHHVIYGPDSIRPQSHNENGSHSLKRKQEAINHPERFLLICLSCHNKIEPRGLKLRHQHLEVG